MPDWILTEGAGCPLKIGFGPDSIVADWHPIFRARLLEAPWALDKSWLEGFQCCDHALMREILLKLLDRLLKTLLLEFDSAA